MCWLCSACSQYALGNVAMSIYQVTDLTFDTPVAALHAMSLSCMKDSTVSVLLLVEVGRA